ncbi:MAG: methyltransferase domain-containing protein [Deltaproteobacteria bacterium]|nr:methyltransferase domain-containing protein [Deltaproteobacteria bacterium]
MSVDFTVDTLLRGRVTLLQPLRGFRSSLDPVLLAAFLQPPFGRFIDIGCGTGALSFLLAAADQDASGVGVEIQPRLATLATAGLARNDFAQRVEILHADIRAVSGRPPLAHAMFDLVATNPPYRIVSAGLPSPDPERAQANHEVSLRLDEWLDNATALVKPNGRVGVVYPAERMADLLEGLRHRGLMPARLRLVQPRADKPPSRVLIEARVGGRAEPLLEMPLVLHDQTGGYTAEMKSMLGDVSPDTVGGKATGDSSESRNS